MLRRRLETGLWSASALVLAGALIPGNAWAQSAATEEIPARLRHFEGTVTVQRAAVGETEEALVNLPLGRGDRVVTAADGRVEITLEDGTAIWLDSTSSLDFLSLAAVPDGEMIVRLWAGSVYVDRPQPISGTLGALRLDAPNGSVLLDGKGLFRIDLDEDQSVWLSVYDGIASLTAGGLTEVVGAGQRSLAEAGTAPARATAFNTVDSDAFDGWRAERVAFYADTTRYVRDREYVPQTIAHHAADLEPYGNWAYDTAYSSWYWKPYAALTWSPYRHGRWVYTYRGWAWVPDAPWGYVTTHYGRWHHTDYNGWVWFPGRVWTPASVHWYVSSRYVGWVPLNYYGRPAVGFGVHFGRYGYGWSVTIGFGNNWGWGYPSYGCCGWGYGGHRRYGNRWGHYPTPYYDYGGRGVVVGRTGSAYGGRAVRGLGYRSGVDPWTVVPQENFGDGNAARYAVARHALPDDLENSPRTMLSGTLRARQPERLTPTARTAVTRDGYRSPRGATPADSTRTTAGNPTGAVRSNTPAAAPSRTAVSRSGYRRTPTAGASGAPQTATGASGRVPRAQPRGAVVPRSTVNPADVPRGRATSTRTATPRSGTVAPRSGYSRTTTGPSRSVVNPNRRPSSARPSSSRVPTARPSTGRLPTVRPRTVAPRPTVGGSGARPSSGGPTARPRVSVPRPGGGAPSVGRPSAPRPAVGRPPAPRPSGGSSRGPARVARPRPGGKPPGGGSEDGSGSF